MTTLRKTQNPVTGPLPPFFYSTANKLHLIFLLHEACFAGKVNPTIQLKPNHTFQLVATSCASPGALPGAQFRVEHHHQLHRGFFDLGCGDVNPTTKKEV
jgi:hypothetical protein